MVVVVVVVVAVVVIVVVVTLDSTALKIKQQMGREERVVGCRERDRRLEIVVCGHSGCSCCNL